MKTIAITTANAASISKARALSAQLNLPLVEGISESFPAMLVFTDNKLTLRLTEKNAPGPIFVDFIEGALNHRRMYGGGKNQLIARAVGLKQKEKPAVLDLTAGLGRDGFVLALLGCDVMLCERSPIIYALLQDGFERARQYEWFNQLSLKLTHQSGFDALHQLSKDHLPDVIYMDPMFPEKTKSALVKKEMRVLREVVGDDLDANQLLEAALLKAKKRVVIKRAKLAPTLTNLQPDLVYKGKSSRFDVYLSHRHSD